MVVQEHSNLCKTRIVNPPTVVPSTAPAVPTIQPSNTPSTSPSVNVPTLVPTMRPTLAPVSMDTFNSYVRVLLTVHEVPVDTYQKIMVDFDAYVPQIEAMIRTAYVSTMYHSILVKIASINGNDGTEATDQTDPDIRRLEELGFSHMDLDTYIYTVSINVRDTIEQQTRTSTFIDKASTNLQTLDFFSSTQVALTFDIYSIEVGTLSIDREINEHVDDEMDSSEWQWYEIMIATMVSLIFIISVIGVLHGNGMLQCLNEYFVIFSKVDDVNYVGLAVFSLQVWDLLSDVFFFIQLEASYAATHKQDRTVLQLITVIAAPAFVIIPYFANIKASLGIRQEIIDLNIENTYRWFATNSGFYGALVVCSGGAYASLAFISSKLFGMSIFNCGLTARDLSTFSSMRIFYNLLLENVPQLVIQILFIVSYDRSYTDTVTLYLAVISSVLSIGVSSLSYAFQKQFALERLQFKLSIILKSDMYVSSDAQIYKRQLQILRKNSGMRKHLATEIAETIGVPSTAIEVITVNHNKYGCDIVAIYESAIEAHNERLSKSTNLGEKEFRKAFANTVIERALHVSISEAFGLSMIVERVEFAQLKHRRSSTPGLSGLLNEGYIFSQKDVKLSISDLA